MTAWWRGQSIGARAHTHELVAHVLGGVLWAVPAEPRGQRQAQRPRGHAHEQASHPERIEDGTAVQACVQQRRQRELRRPTCARPAARPRPRPRPRLVRAAMQCKTVTWRKTITVFRKHMSASQ